MRIGIGIGTEFSRFASGSSIDPDAQAFITAAGITDPTQQSAINTLVVDLKAASLWTKMKALYPFVGGTASAHKFNLKDPQDTNAAFRLSFSGGWNHNANGAIPNGINAEADSFIAANAFSQNSMAMGYYSKTNSLSGNQVEIGNGGNNAISFYYASVTSDIAIVNNAFATGYQTPPTKTNLFFQVSRTASNLTTAYKDGTSVGTKTTASSIPSSTTIKIGSNNGTNYSSKICAFVYFSEGLTGTEMGNLYNLVQSFQTTLGRAN